MFISKFSSSSFYCRRHITSCPNPYVSHFYNSYNMNRFQISELKFRNRVVTSDLISLLSICFKSLKTERICIQEEHDKNLKYINSLISSTRLLILDGQEKLALNLIQLICTIQRAIRHDNVYAASWSYHVTLQLVNLLHMSNISCIPQLEETIKILHQSEIIYRKRINQVGF